MLTNLRNERSSKAVYAVAYVHAVALQTHLLTHHLSSFLHLIPASHYSNISISSDRSGQPTYHMVQSLSLPAIIPENGSEIVDWDASSSVSIIDRNDKELEEARHAITRFPFGHPEWLNRALILASLLSNRFEETSRDILLVECIDIQRQICVFCTPGSPHRAHSVSNLASSLRTLSMQRGEESLLSEAIVLNREAVSLRPRGHPDRSASCNNLAMTLCISFWQTGAKSLLDEAINLSREALSLCPIGHPERSVLCNSLALSLNTCYDETGEESLLAEAVDLHREAFSLRCSGHPERWKSCQNLANSLYTRFNQTGEESLLEEAIKLHREALSLRASGHPDRSGLCNSLASSLYARFIQTGEELLLTEATDLQKEALSLRPKGHPEWPMLCNNLANSLWTRFNQTGEELLLAEAIELHREALPLQPSGHPDRFMSCNNLATSLMTLFKQTGRESLLAEAIELHREALSLQPSGHPERFRSCSNLALTLHSRFEYSRNESLLVEAIHLHREALSLQTSAHPHQLEVCSRLVASLRTYFEHTGDESLVIEAIDLSKDIVKTQPKHHTCRWKPIINLSYIYLNRRFSQANIVLAIDYMQQALSLPSDDWPTLLSEVARLTSLIDLPMLPQDSLSQLLLCFSAVIDLACRVAGFILNPQSQLRYLSSSRHLGPQAYWCALACGQSQLGLELVERTRAVMWTQALHMRDSQLSGAPPELASELEVLLSKMHTSRASADPMSLSSHDQDVRHKNSDRIHQLIQQIRALPGQERFMRGLSFKELAQCASHNVVVVLISTECECHALVLQPSNQEPVTLELYGITPNELEAMSAVISVAERRGSAPDGVHDDYRGMKLSPTQNKARSYSALGKLWTTIVKPVINRIQFQKASGSLRPRLHWCPTGPFTFLPLHAAGIYDSSNAECCADYVVSSYTPTLTALLRAQKFNPSFHWHEAKLGLVAAMKTWDVGLPTLRYVEDEVNLVRAAAEGASISINHSNHCVGNATTVMRVSEVLKNTNFVHIACHGTQNTLNSLSSGYCLSDGNLTIARLMDLDLKDSFFAFMSACETAKGDEKQPDQTIHLAAAMLFVGFRSVVATMWAMNDVDGPLVAELFYKRLFREDLITPEAIPYALDYAVSELRKTGVSPERWATFIHMGA